MNAFRALVEKVKLKYTPRADRLAAKAGKEQRERRQRARFRKIFARTHNHDPYEPREKVDHVVKPGTLLNWKGSPLGYRGCPVRWIRQGETHGEAFRRLEQAARHQELLDEAARQQIQNSRRSSHRSAYSHQRASAGGVD